MKNYTLNKLIALIWMLFLAHSALAQTPEQDFDIAVVTPMVGPSLNSTLLLKDKLQQALSVNGRVAISRKKINDEIGGSESDFCFVLFPNVNEISRNITTAPPILHTIELSITLFITGYDVSSTFGSYSFTVKGAGNTYEKAYIDAMKRINPSNAVLQDYIVSTKSKIRKYYTENCDYLMNEAESIAQRTNINDEGYNSFIKSINILTQISKVNPKCYSEASDKVQDIYERYRKFACSYYLTMAKIQWTARNNKDAIKWDKFTNVPMDVFYYLKKIPPSTYCEKELNDFLKDIERNNVKFEDRDFNVQRFRDSTVATVEGMKLSNQSKILDAALLSNIGLQSRKESASTAVNININDKRPLAAPAKSN